MAGHLPGRGAIRVEPDLDNITKPKSVKAYGEKEGFRSLVNALPFRLGGRTVFGTGAGLYARN